MTDGSGRLLDSLKDKVHDAEFAFYKLEKAAWKRETLRAGCQKRGEQAFRVFNNRESLAAQKRANGPGWVPDAYLPSNASRARRREKKFVTACVSGSSCLQHEDPDTEALAQGFAELERLLSQDGGLSEARRLEAYEIVRADERAAAKKGPSERFLPSWQSDLIGDDDNEK